MKNLTFRQKQIIKIISQQEPFSKGKNIAEQLRVSLRTIQSEIAHINHSFSQEIITSNNHGYFINKNLLDLQVILNDENDDLLSILKKLILEDKKWQIDEFADINYISTSTLLTKIKQIRFILVNYNLEINRKNNYLWITGSEYDKRRFIHKLILDEVKPLFMNLENCSAYFIDMDVLFIKSIITHSIRKYNAHMEECYSLNLYLNITIALSRMKQNYHMEVLEDMNIDPNSIEYLIADDICRQYATHNTIKITDEDIAYITLLILGQVKLLIPNTKDGNELIDHHFKRDVSDILMKTFNYYMLNIDYEPFLNNFVLHVDALIKRAIHHQFVSNVIAENIKSSCPFIYDVSVYLAKQLEDKYQITISDEEIGFIAIHIGFVIENSTKENNLIHVTLLCNDYHQTANNILSKLKENYSGVIEITNIISNFNQTSFESTSDLIISTLPIDIIGKEVVIISPFYTMMDHLAIDHAIHSCLQIQETKKEQQLLLSYFHENLFFKQTDLDEKESVIKFLGKQIENFGLSEKGFVDSVLRREQMSSTCFFETFAIPHAIELNAKKTMFCVLINEKGIQWNQHRIKIVLMIAVQRKDRKSFMKIYNSIIHVLWNKEKLNKLVHSNTLSEFLEYLKYDIS